MRLKFFTCFLRCRRNLYFVGCLATIFFILIVSLEKTNSGLPLVSRKPKFEKYLYEESAEHNEVKELKSDESDEVKFDESTTVANEEVTYNSTDVDQDTITAEHRDDDEKPLIMLWNSQKYPPRDIPDEPICGGGCRLTRNRITFKLSAAVVFTMKEFNASDLPKRHLRDSSQVYVWWCEESTWTSKIFYNKDFKQIEENFFNWTMTYKRNSEVNAMMIPYNAREYVIENVKRKNGPSDSVSGLVGDDISDDSLEPPRTKSEWEIFAIVKQAREFISRKKKMAVWVASNCGYTAGAIIRKRIVTKLQSQGLEVDIYGKCGDENIPGNLTGYLDLLSQYRFYLAFENSFHCREYITEKFWYNGLYAGAVPIVWGPLKSDIMAVAPEKSFIFYEDFATAGELVTYLKNLSNDKDAYLEYFSWWWKLPGTFPVYGITETTEDVGKRNAMLDFEMSAFCHLCSLLNQGIHLKEKKSILSLHDWWYEGENAACFVPTYDVN